MVHENIDEYQNPLAARNQSRQRIRNNQTKSGKIGKLSIEPL
jgi:hypothetical protein